VSAAALLARIDAALRVGATMSNDQFISVVSASEGTQTPYPYVYVNLDGTVRELHPKEREYLETPFHPFDGARPYVKQKYEEKNGWGEIKGFCPRSAIPSHLIIGEPPSENPLRKLSALEWVNDIRERATRMRAQKATAAKRLPWWRFWG